MTNPADAVLRWLCFEPLPWRLPVPAGRVFTLCAWLLRLLQAVQPHMGKCFDGIRRLDFGEDPKSTDISAMISGGGPSSSRASGGGGQQPWVGGGVGAG